LSQILSGDITTDIQDNRQSAIFSATFSDRELFPFAVDCTRAMNLSLDNLQSTAFSLENWTQFYAAMLSAYHLTFAGVGKDPVRSPTVRIAKLLS
jgi:hypothetical protein